MQYRYFILSLSVFLFCVVTLIFWSKPEPPVQTIHFDCGAKFEGIGTIFGGEKAEQNSWPWLVAFLYVPKNSFFCGGSLISKRHVLSAAHCFHSKIKKNATSKEHVNVFVGKHNLSIDDEPNTSKYEVQLIINHPQWNCTERSYLGDISLVVVFKDVTFTDFVKPICLPEPSHEDPSGGGIVVGWGRSEYSDLLNTYMDPTPNEIQTPIVSAKECFNDFPLLAEITSKKSFCAGFKDQTKSICSGDSGGGFFSIHIESGRYYLKGIVSASMMTKITCNKEAYSIFTDVANFSKWIRHQLKESLVWKDVGFHCKIIYGLLYPTCQHNFTSSMSTNTRIGEVSGLSDSNTQEIAFDFKPATGIFSGVGKTFPELIVIHIDSTPLIFIQRRDFENLPKLKRLELKYNQIEFLPEDVFCDMHNLETLNLNGNSIKNLPENIFKNLVSLEKINCDDNMIRHLPEKLFRNNEKMREIEFSGNKLTSIGVDFTKMTNIINISLDVSQCADFSISNGENVVELQKHINKNCAKEPNITEESDIEYIGDPQIFPEKTLESTVKCGERFSSDSQASNETKEEANKWPWLVAFINWPKNEFICSGSLISSRHVLSAAYCFKGKNQVHFIDAIVGKQRLSKVDEPESANHDIWKVVTHPESSKNLFDADVSLVILTREVTFTDHVQPVCLPESSQTISMGTVVSWEFEQQNMSLVITPEEHSATIINKIECIALSPNLKDAVTNQTFCAKFKNESKSSCNLDLGDSLYVENLKKFYVRGIFGYVLNGTYANCGIKTRVVYIDIKKFTSWIYEEMLKDVRYQEKSFNCVKDAKRNAQRVQCSEFDSFPVGNSFKSKITTYSLFDYAGTNFKNLKHLLVTQTSLKSLKRIEFTKLTGLETFEFTMNDVEYLCEDIFWDLTNLTNLSLRGNGLKTISENHFIKMESLKIIDLSFNKLEYLQADLFEKNLKLEEILMSDNPLKEILFDFTHLPLLKVLDLTNAGCVDNKAESTAEVSVMVNNICKNNNGI